MADVTLCNMMDCTRPPRFQPILLAYSSLANIQNPIEMQFEMGICKYHKLQLGPEDLLTDMMWAQFISQIEQAGKVAPDRKALKLKWVRIEKDL